MLDNALNHVETLHEIGLCNFVLKISTIWDKSSAGYDHNLAQSSMSDFGLEICGHLAVGHFILVPSH